MLDRRFFLGSALLGGSVTLASRALAQDAGKAPSRPDAIEALADYIVRTRYEDLPASALAVTRSQLLDTVSIAIAGRNEAGVRELRELGREIGGKGESVVWGSSLRLPAHDAARINAVMTHAHEFDDTFGRGFLHPSAITIPAALAVADMVGNVSGRELLAAVTLGVDIACRLSVSSQPGVDGFTTGWHNTTLDGYLVSAMIAGRLMKLSQAQIVNAAGIAGHQAAGNAQSHIDGALTKRLGPGFASAAGVLAARLAARGAAGPRGVLEGAKGWYRQYHHGNYSRELLLGGLGVSFPSEEMSFKPWPSCRGSHSSADAALQLVSGERLAPGQIERVLIRNGPAEWPFLSNPIERKRRPTSTVEAQFSIPWVVAAALVDGKVRLAHFTDEALHRGDIRAMTDRIATVQDDRLANPRGGPGQAEVEVTTRDGRVVRRLVAYPKGDPETPMTRSEIDAKFADCADYGGMPAGRAAALKQLVERVDALADVSKITAAMAMKG
ncbi:MAG: MmgE/PrpD family protein [Sphingomonadales bacterium]|nr:MAG: MmgE/PrpD family protein [Sphingomonadales bacterium]